MEEYQEIWLGNTNVMDVLECLIKTYRRSFKDLKQGSDIKFVFLEAYSAVSVDDSCRGGWSQGDS